MCYFMGFCSLEFVFMGFAMFLVYLRGFSCYLMISFKNLHGTLFKGFQCSNLEFKKFYKNFRVRILNFFSSKNSN